MRVRYTGESTVRVGTQPIHKGDEFEIDDATGSELLERDDYEQAGSGPTTSVHATDDPEEEI